MHLIRALLPPLEKITKDVPYPCSFIFDSLSCCQIRSDSFVAHLLEIYDQVVHSTVYSVFKFSLCQITIFVTEHLIDETIYPVETAY